MIKPTSSDKTLIRVLIGIGVSLALMLFILHFLGELQGLIVIVIALLVQISLLTGRVVTLERELRISRDTPDSLKTSEKTV